MCAPGRKGIFGGNRRWGDDELRDQDDETKVAAFGILDNMKEEYQMMMNPDTGFFANKLDTVRKDDERATEQAQEQFDLSKTQASRAFTDSKSQGEASYQQALASNRADIKNLLRKSQEEALGARDQASDTAYSMSLTEGMGGLAGVGERARRSLSAKRDKGVDAIALSTKMQKESADRQLAQTEQNVNISRSQSASAMNSANESANLALDQTRENVQAELQKNITDIGEQRAKLANKFISDALNLQSSTTGAFKDEYSSWAGSDHSGDEDGDIADTAGSGNDWDHWESNEEFEEKFNEGLG